MTLDSIQTLALAAAILMLGRLLNRAIPLLARYNIPEPITGGLAWAGCTAALFLASGTEIAVSGVLRGPLLLAFFTTIGLGADLRRLRQGGPALAVFLLCVVPFLAVQNAAGVGLAMALDQHPLVGLLGGSVTMVGGHGTGAAYAQIFSDTHNLVGAPGMALAAATCGLILGGVVGGPVAQFLLRGHRPPAGGAADTATAPVRAEATAAPEAVTGESTLVTLALIAFCLLAGGALAEAARSAPVALPDFLWCLFAGIAVRNAIAPVLKIRISDPSVDVLGSLSLALFLAMTMATLKLWELATLAAPLMIILAVQVGVAVLYATLVVYRAMGRNYEAAVMTAGFLGFSMGATATAIANMQAVSGRYGPAPKAFLVVPLTGAFFIDIANALVLTGALALPVFGE